MISNSARLKWNSFFTNSYNNTEWLCIKISILILIGPSIFYNLLRYNPQLYPVGLCKWIDCTVFNNNIIKYALAAIILILLVLYLFEKSMIWVTLLLFVFTLIIYTIEESNGIKGRRGLFSLIFLAQFFAYLFKDIKLDLNLNRNRIQFCGQLIAGVYTLAALSKLYTSGLAWFAESPRIILQITKSYYFEFTNSGSMSSASRGIEIANWISTHNNLILLLLGSSLILEIFSFLMLANKRIGFIYAILLLCMHIGIQITMDIFFPTVSYPLIIFFINPLYLVFLTFSHLNPFTPSNSTT